ncbi:MAG: hypothetical protein JWM76_3885 [Pseudonocardiales bacterium]|nr:hypothetical protein [Pseudonocardiales bacterium]
MIWDASGNVHPLPLLGGLPGNYTAVSVNSAGTVVGSTFRESPTGDGGSFTAVRWSPT